MLSGVFPRNGLLILSVVISHMALLMLLSGSYVGAKSSAQDTLLVSLVGKSTLPSSRQKSLVTPPKGMPINNALNSSSAADESHVKSDSNGAGDLGGGSARQVIHSPKPHYPLASRQLKEQGLVVARLCVSEYGLVQEVGITKSSGYAGLDRSALTTLSQWRFAPIAVNLMGHSSQCFQTPIQFTLEG